MTAPAAKANTASPSTSSIAGLDSAADRHSSDSREEPSSRKTSPSDVIFGQPPGRDEPSQLYEQLASDSVLPSGSSGRGGATIGYSANHIQSPLTAKDPASSGSSGGSSSDQQMEVGPVGGVSIHATPSTAGTEASHDVRDDLEDVKYLPALFEDCDADDIVLLVADMLSRLTVHNDSLPLHPSSLTRFHSRAPPGISVLSYLKRIAKYTSLEKSCTLILLVYIDRVCQRNAGFTICSLTVHRFVCTAVVCASKALCDAFSTNGHYARVGSISLVELNMLEKEFLNIIDWKLSCSGALLHHYYTSLVRSHSAYRLESSMLTSPAFPPPAGLSALPIDSGDEAMAN